MNKVKIIPKISNKNNQNNQLPLHLSGCPANWLKEKTRCDCSKLKEDIFWSIY